jgi:excisionase family DNA binding protein
VNRSDRKPSPVQPLLLTPEQAAATLGVGRTFIYALIRDERLRSITSAGHGASPTPASSTSSRASAAARTSPPSREAEPAR